MSDFDSVLARIRAGDYDVRGNSAKGELDGGHRLKKTTEELLQQRKITWEENLSLLIEWTERQDDLARYFMSRFIPEPPTVPRKK